ncbi:MAG: patatin-like phospholipase family protein [Pseudomonadales bacterium]|jgi:NTE family protein
MTKTIGLSLGGGGAKGLAHIAVLETLDEMGIQVKAISGTSIGAIIGTIYASGLSGRDIRLAVDTLLEVPMSFREAWTAKRPFGWLELLNLDLARSHLFNVDPLVDEIRHLIAVQRIEDLGIPMQIVAADFWERSEVVFDSGPIIPAIQASFCLPGIFEPITINDTVLVDGGCVNPIPFDLIRDQCDIVIAVDVLGKRVPEGHALPTFSDALFNTFQIAEKSIAVGKMKTHPPDIYIEPDIIDVKVMEFQKAEQIYTETQPECIRLKVELEKLLGE